MAVNLQSEITNTKAYLNEAKKTLVLLSQDPDLDQTAAGLSLYLALNKIGKLTTIASSKPVTVELSNLVGVDKITQTIGGKNFIISLDYVEGSIEKVSYNIEGNKFNLVIEPKDGTPQLDPSKVTYSYGGGDFDLLFVVGTPNLENLGSFYTANTALFSQKPVINIDINRSNTKFGRTNFVLPTASSTSEIVSLLLRSLGVKLDSDIASNLLKGIYSATNNLSFKTTADTFEAVAFCLRYGGKTPTGQVLPSIQAKTLGPIPTTLPAQDVSLSVQPSSPPTTQVKPQPITSPQTAQPVPESIQKTQRKQTPSKTPPYQEETPSDWLKPKIYRSGRNVVGSTAGTLQPSQTKTNSKLL